MWYSQLYRRHLLDMHIEDWSDDFLSEFSPEVYVENLKKAEINYAMIYLQSHVGLCYYPTKVGVMHKQIEKQPDMIKRVVDLCHRNGIRVCGYYSLIYNTREHDRHPLWRMKKEDGFSAREGKEGRKGVAFVNVNGSRYGHCCPNNMEYRQFVYNQIDEILDYFECDALFFDMPFWPHTCYCDACQKAYGGEIPKEINRELVEFKAKSMGEFVQSITGYVKKRQPDMPVEHNFANAVAGDTSSACIEEVLAACDYVGGDLYGNLYNHSFACKFFKNATLNPPFEQMFSRCKPKLRVHTLTKTKDEMKTALSSTMAHHGATLVIDAIDPVGTMDRRVYEQVGEIFRFQKKYEPFFTGEMVEEIGLYYGLRSRNYVEKENARVCCVNASKTLVRAHIPFGVTGVFHELSQYKIIVAPVLSELEDKDNERLIEYVRNGGVLYLSGGHNTALLKELTGHVYMSKYEERCVYVAPKAGYEEIFGEFNGKYPLPVMETKAAIVACGEAKVLATLTFPYTRHREDKYAAIHSDPPGIASDVPAVTVNDYGKGKVIWSAVPLEAIEFEEYRKVFVNLLHIAGRPDYFFCSDAPKNVEITAFTDKEKITVNVMVLDEEAITTPAAPFSVKVKEEVSSIRLLPDGEEIPFSIEKGYTVFQTRAVDIFDMYELKRKEK